MKDFVPYQEALELKELGFDEPCFGKWLSSLQSNWKNYELILEMGMNEAFEDNRNVYLLQGACSAPTYSEAFRWFREKYNLKSCIIFRTSMEDNKEYYDWLIKGQEVVYRHFTTYEQAELACLQKLIELVKN
jgi:hypothetical protein